MKTKMLELEVHVPMEFDGPEIAVVPLSEDLQDRIRHLAGAAKELGVVRISTFDGSPEFFRCDIDAEEGARRWRPPADEDEQRHCRTECVMLNVSATDFFWSGYVKHTDIRFSTEAGSVSDLSPSPTLAVVLEGGLVQSIVSDQPGHFRDLNLVVIDYDTEGAPRRDLTKVPQSDGNLSDALARFETVELATIDLAQTGRNLQG